MSPQGLACPASRQISGVRLHVFPLLLLTLLLAACASTKEAEMRAVELQRQNTSLQQRNSQLETELAENKAVAARLQMELVDKQTRIARLKSAKEGLAQEVTQPALRFSVPSTKVEAVTFLAEVAAEIETARETLQIEGPQLLAKADRLLTDSRVELEQGHYDPACSLAAQALESVRTQRLQSALHGKEKVGVYADFLLPLRLELTKRSNFRRKPSMRSEIFDTLEQGTLVTATGYQGSWIKVHNADGRIGWVYSILLAIPEAHSPFLSPIR
ncbi:MAG: hypothetical protein BWK76_17085 [Desulfobulbaceae bacterium A2]|nr:MAG: hypothetical protein BWK76_17085 [Desulfobulbaceae bacterium A2]